MLACSGPGAMALIEHAERRGWTFFAIAAAAVVAFAIAVPAIRRRTFVRHWDLAVLLVVQPGLWMSARMGDCGHMLRTAAPLGLVLLVAGFAWIYGRAKRRDDPDRL